MRKYKRGDQVEVIDKHTCNGRTFVYEAQKGSIATVLEQHGLVLRVQFTEHRDPEFKGVNDLESSRIDAAAVRPVQPPPTDDEIQTAIQSIQEVLHDRH